MSHTPPDKPKWELYTDVYPPVPIKSPPKDGRTVALSTLSIYLSNLKFYKYNAKTDQVDEFCIPEANIETDYPDYETDFSLPALAILPGKVDYRPNGLTTYVKPDTVDVFQRDTVLQIQDEHEEILTLEFWARYKAEIRAIAAGVEQIFHPSDQLAGLRFTLRDYFNTPVIFTLLSKAHIAEPDAAINRRRVLFEVNMRFNVSRLVPYRTLLPSTDVDVT